MRVGNPDCKIKRDSQDDFDSCRVTVNLSSPAALHSWRMRMAAVAFRRVFLIIPGWTQVCGIPQEHLPREDGRGKRRFDCSEALLSIRQPHARGSFSLNHP